MLGLFDYLQQQQAPKMSLEEATKSAGLVFDPFSKMYYLPKTGQFYQMGVPKPQEQPQAFNLFFQPPKVDEKILNVGGYAFNPYTGTLPGVTAGMFSPIDRYQQQQQQISPPVDILNALFGNIDFSRSANTTGPSYGAGRFLGDNK